MSTDETLQISVTSLEQSLKLAASIGSRLRGGEVIEFVSDLGGGKTTFVRGLASGAGSNAAVMSPTFTISNQYEAKALTLHHFDFYRILGDAGIMREELSEILQDPNAVTLVEWADPVLDVLPEDRLRITISVTGEHNRHLTMRAPKKLHYLIQDL